MPPIRPDELEAQIRVGHGFRRRVTVQEERRMRGDKIRCCFLLSVIVTAAIHPGTHTSSTVGRRARSDGGSHLIDHRLWFYAHEVGRVDGATVTVQQPDRGAVGLPPEDGADVVGGGGGGAEPELGGDDAALVVGAEEDAEDGVEEEPGG